MPVYIAGTPSAFFKQKYLHVRCWTLDNTKKLTQAYRRMVLNSGTVYRNFSTPQYITTDTELPDALQYNNSHLATDGYHGDDLTTTYPITTTEYLEGLELGPEILAISNIKTLQGCEMFVSTIS